MTATVFLTQYASFAGRRPGGEDDIAGGSSDLPGEIVARNEINASAPGDSISLDGRTSFIEIEAVDGGVYFNFDPAGVDSLVENNRGRLGEDMSRTQGVLEGKTGKQRYKQINIVDIS